MGKKTKRLFREVLRKNNKRGHRAAVSLRLVKACRYPRLLELVLHPDARVRARLCSTLGELGGYFDSGPRLTPLGIPALLQRLHHDPKPRVRAAAAQGLSHQVRPGMLPALCVAAQDSSKKVRRGVCHALGMGLWESGVTLPQKRQVQAVFLCFLADPDAYVREWAAFYIHCQGCSLDSPEIRTALWRLVDDPKDAVRAEACATLGLLGDHAIVPYLIRQFETGTVWSWNLDAAAKLSDPAFLPVLYHLRSCYRKKHWFYKSVAKTIQEIQSKVS